MPIVIGGNYIKIMGTVAKQILNHVNIQGDYIELWKCFSSWQIIIKNGNEILLNAGYDHAEGESWHEGSIDYVDPAVLFELLYKTVQRSVSVKGLENIGKFNNLLFNGTITIPADEEINIKFPLKLLWQVSTSFRKKLSTALKQKLPEALKGLPFRDIITGETKYIDKVILANNFEQTVYHFIDDDNLYIEDFIEEVVSNNKKYVIWATSDNKIKTIEIKVDSVPINIVWYEHEGVEK